MAHVHVRWTVRRVAATAADRVAYADEAWLLAEEEAGGICAVVVGIAGARVRDAPRGSARGHVRWAAVILPASLPAVVDLACWVAYSIVLAAFLYAQLLARQLGAVAES